MPVWHVTASIPGQTVRGWTKAQEAAVYGHIDDILKGVGDPKTRETHVGQAGVALNLRRSSTKAEQAEFTRRRECKEFDSRYEGGRIGL